MGANDPRVDAYIAKSPAFARPILTHFRSTVHAARPDIVETIKWGAPMFEHHGIVCSMAAFKTHCRLGFWRMSQIQRPDGMTGHGITGWYPHVTSLKELPPKAVLLRLVKAAARLNEDGVKVRRPKRPASAPRALDVPDGLLKALRSNRKALATFEAFSYTNRKDYVEWISEAKREETRASRIATAVEWLAEGKPRNWKYMSRSRHA